MNDVIASARFEITANGEKIYMTLELVPSGAFAYGNGHALVLTREENGLAELFDARYDKRFASKESFDKNAYDFMRDYTDSKYDVKRVK